VNATTNNRLWIIGSMALVLAIIAMGWFLGVSPKLSEAASASDQRTAAEAQNLTQEREVAKIKKQYERLPELQAELATVRAAVPSGGAMSALLDELHSLEQQNNVTLTDFTAGDAQPYTPVESTSPRLVTTNSLVTAENFVAIDVSVSVTGDESRVMNFINGLQTGSRLFLVTDLALTQTLADSDSSTSSDTAQAAISGLVYVLLDNPPAPAKTAKTAEAPKG